VANLRRILLPLALALLAGCAATTMDSRWRDREVVVDGQDAEWDAARFWFEESHAAVGLMNDRDYLYLTVALTDPYLEARILRQGFTVWVDPHGGRRSLTAAFLGTTPGPSVGLGFEVPGSPARAWRRRPGAGPGGPGGMPPAGMGGEGMDPGMGGAMPGGMGGGRGRRGAEGMPGLQPEPLRLWTRVRLARTHN
jgi:hypothetical protein